MKIRNALFLVVALSLFAAGALQAQDRPNILLIYMDDMGWKDAGFLGSDYYDTPNIDKLASQSMFFTDAYANAPLCAPSRACLTSGQYTPRHGVYIVSPGPQHDWYNDYMPRLRRQQLVAIQNNYTLPNGTVGMAQALADGGYTTGFTGKWHHFPRPEQMGFDQVLPAPKSPGDPKSMVRITDNAIGFLRENAARPFFFYVSHHAPHGPAESHPETLRRYQEKKRGKQHDDPEYAAMLADADHEIGRLLDELDRLEIAQKTVVVFYSDNGAYEPRSDNAPLASGKGMVYEGGIRVPLLVRWPGVVKPGSRNHVPVIGTDLYPTFVEIAGAEPPKYHTPDGESLVPLLKGGESLKRAALFWHHPTYYIWEPMRQTPCSVIRQGDWKLIEYFEDGGSLELYNLKDDIGEANNLAKKMPGKAAELHEALKRWRAETFAPVPSEKNPFYDPAYRIEQAREEGR